MCYLIFEWSVLQNISCKPCFFFVNPIMKYPMSNINPDKDKQKYLKVALPNVNFLKF